VNEYQINNKVRQKLSFTKKSQEKCKKQKSQVPERSCAMPDERLNNFFLLQKNYQTKESTG